MAFRSVSKADKPKSAWGRKPTGTSAEAQKLYTLQVDLAAGPIEKKYAGKAMSCVIEIAGSHTLEQLHDVIHQAFDRAEKRRWEFQVGGKGLNDSMNRRYGPRDLKDDQVDDACETRIEDLKLRQGKAFGYIFDLDDPAEHSIEVLNIIKAGRALADPKIVQEPGESAPEAADEDS